MSSTSISEKTASRSQIPALDGIRAIAVLAVIIFHVHPAALPGGFMGVDIFFVLSGFLITSIISHDLRAGTFSFKEFYLRRIQRLLPNAITTVAVTVLVLLLFYPMGMENQAGRHGIWTLLNLSNIFAWRSLGDYWGDSAENAPFTHFWSLGIEEQFYILFPLFFFLLFRYAKKSLYPLLGILGILSFVFCLRETNLNSVAAFYLPHFRFWELLFGAIFAIKLQVFENRLISTGSQERNFYKITNKCTLCALLGLLLILSAIIFSPKEVAFTGWSILFPTLGTGLLLFSICSGASLFLKFLEISVVTSVGKVSYSLYLWHWPAIIIGKLYGDFHGWDPLTGAIVGAVIGGVLAILAYRLIECPLRKRGKGRSLRLGITGVLFISTLSLCFVAKHYVSEKFIRSQFNPIITSGELYDDFTEHKEIPEGIVFEKDENGNEVHFNGFEPWSDIRFLFSRKKPTQSGILKSYSGNALPTVVVIGSSHAQMYSRLIDDICREQKITVLLGGGSNIPVFPDTGESLAWRPESVIKSSLRQKKMISDLQENQPELFFLIDRWDGYKPEILENDLTTFLDNLNSLRTKVIFVAQVPVSPVGQKQNFRKAVNFLADNSGEFPAIFPDNKEKLRREILERVRKIAEKRPEQFIAIRPDLLFYKPDGSIRYAEGKTFYYMDDDHLSDAGAELARPVFEKILSDLSVGESSKQSLRKEKTQK